MRKTGRIIATLAAAIATATVGADQAQATDGPLPGILSPLVCVAQNNVYGNNNHVNQTASCQQSATPAPPVNGGVTGYEIIHLPSETVPNGTTRVVRCPAGKQALGGGAEAGGIDPVLVTSAPVLDFSGWYAVARSETQANVTLGVYVICANAAA
ncbi:hypothetical protein ACIRU3_32850 [Streptomyces sp. NPDC101151]|uniref:hypothetical protein n=1 Tax=Streptomyces sp. NPDC101151 TaxID=3366115 RepID=UPI00382686C7